MSKRYAVIATDRPAECGSGVEDSSGAIIWCNEPGVRVYLDVMWSEDVPAMYPPGSERQLNRYGMSACPRHLWELAEEKIAQTP